MFVTSEKLKFSAICDLLTVKGQHLQKMVVYTRKSPTCSVESNFASIKILYLALNYKILYYIN